MRSGGRFGQWLVGYDQRGFFRWPKLWCLIFGHFWVHDGMGEQYPFVCYRCKVYKNAADMRTDE